MPQDLVLLVENDIIIIISIETISRVLLNSRMSDISRMYVQERKNLKSSYCNVI